MRKKRALIISPFATAPLDAGQRLRAYQSTRMFQDLGYQITFLLYAFENPWYWRTQPDLLATLREQWGDVRVIYSKRQVSAPPASGELHQLDEWWDEELGKVLERTFKFEEFDICVVHNVWLSKAFDFVPPRTTKVIDTHDVFSTRRDTFQANGIKPEFFLVDWNAERFGLERAELVLTIKPEEAEVLRGHGLKRSVLNLPYVSTVTDRGEPLREYRSRDKVRFGFLGTSHSFNKAGLEALLLALDREVKRTLAPVEVVIAGTISAALNLGGLHLRPIRLGYVDSEAEFYDSVDVAIVPVFNGTGFKVKVAELVQLRKPLLCAQHAAEGVTLNEDQVFADPAAMARAMVDVALHRPPLEEMSRKSAIARLQIEADYEDARRAIQGDILKRRHVQIFLPPEGPMDAAALAQLVTTVLQARAMAHTHWSLVVAPDSWKLDLDALNQTATLGLQFTTLAALEENRAALARSDVRVFMHPGCGPRALAELEALNLRRASTVADCRFSDLDELTEADLRTLERAGTLLLNHRQGGRFDLIPVARRQEFFCGPLLSWEATWDPNVAALVRRFLRDVPTRECRAMIVHSGATAGRALALLAATGATPDVVMFDLDKPDERDRAAATLLWAIFGTNKPFDYVHATGCTSWLHALAEHGTHLAGRIRSLSLAQFLGAAPRAEVGQYRPPAVASGHVYREMEKRLARADAAAA